MFHLAQFYWKEAMAYRAQMMFTVLITPLRFLVLITIWSALFQMNAIDSIKGFSLSMLISYFMITNFVSIFTYDEIHQFLEREIRYGNFIVHMLKPANVVWLQLMRKIAMRGFAVIVEIVPVLVIFLVFFREHLVGGSYLFFVVSCAMAFIISYLVFLLIGSLAFWFVNIRSFAWLVQFGVQLASGMLVPIDLFPPLAQSILSVLPFQHIAYTPTMIYLGRAEVWHALGMQAMWVLILAVIAGVVWQRAIRRFSGVGA
ncbi:MAG: ABC transporter permease [Nanobdellota archaeon]